MKIKIFLVALVLLALFTVAAMAALNPQMNQNIAQEANQAVNGSMTNNLTINQNTEQNANQNALGPDLISPGVNQNTGQSANQSITGSSMNNSVLNQSITQKANQNVQGPGLGGPTINQSSGQSSNQTIQNANLNNSTINQNLVQNTNQNISWNVQNYFVMNSQTVTITSEQETVLSSRAQDFLVSFPRMRMFIMPLADLNGFEASRRADVAVLNVGSMPNPKVSFIGVINVPLGQLIDRIDEIPLDRTIAVVGDDDMESAIGMTILRLRGFNAWAVRLGIC